MRITEVIPARYWHHTPTNRKASIYGALPWVVESDKANWQMVTFGFTWRLDNGTIGLGRRPVKTMEEAQTVMDTFNAK